MVYVTLNSLIKPWHALDIYHLSQLSLYGAIPIPTTHLIRVLTVCNHSYENLESLLFLQLNTHKQITSASQKTIINTWCESLEKVIRSLTVLDFVFIWELSKLWLTQPCGLYCELVHGSKVGFSMQKAPWGDKGRNPSQFPSASKRKTVYTSCLTSEVRSKHMNWTFHKRGGSIRRTSTYTYTQWGAPERVCFAAICWDLWLVCVCGIHCNWLPLWESTDSETIHSSLIMVLHHTHTHTLKIL